MLGAWLKPGAHVNGVGSHSVDARELDTEAIVRSKVVGRYHRCRAGRGRRPAHPIKEGAITADHIYAELGDILTGKKPGRTSDQEITLFKSQGIAIQDVATAQLVYRMAKERGIGTEVNL